jgi:hypothetical protein
MKMNDLRQIHCKMREEFGMNFSAEMSAFLVHLLFQFLDDESTSSDDKDGGGIKK